MDLDMENVVFRAMNGGTDPGVTLCEGASSIVVARQNLVFRGANRPTFVYCGWVRLEA